MEDIDFLKGIAGKSKDEVLLGVTLRYLDSLQPAQRIGVYYGAILRWFNAGLLRDVMAVGIPALTTGAAEGSAVDADQLYAELQNLPFAEVFPRRGHSFHELTRKTILEHLWTHEKEFYRQVSGNARDYFRDSHERLLAQLSQLQDDSATMDWSNLVEYSYHLVIADGEEAITRIGRILDELISIRMMGTYHAIVEAVAEHARAGRVAPGEVDYLDLWRMCEAYVTADISRLEDLHSKLSSQPDLKPEIKASVSYYFADGLRLATRLEEARVEFEAYLRLSAETGDLGDKMEAQKGLGNTAFDKEDYETAKEHYESALLTLATMPVQDAARDLVKERDIRPFLFDPGAWRRREWLEEKEGATEKTSRYAWSVDLGSDGQQEATELPLDINSAFAGRWINLGYTYRALDQYDMASRCGRLAMQIYGDLEDLGGQQDAAQLLRSFGVTIADIEFTKAVRNFQSLLIDQASGTQDRNTLLTVLINQALSDLDEDNDKNALEKLKRALPIARDLGLLNEVAVCLNSLARIDWNEKKYDDAEKKFTEAADLFKKVNNLENWASTLNALGNLKRARLRLAESEEELRAALRVYDELGTLSGRFFCLISLSDVILRQGRDQESLELLVTALVSAREAHRKSLEIKAESEMAKLFLSLGNFEQAEPLFRQALSDAAGIGQKDLMKSILIDKAFLLSAMTEYEKAVSAVDEVLAIDPEAKDALQHKGWALENLDRSRARESLQAYEKAAALDPGNPWPEKGMADAYRYMGDFEKADALSTALVARLEQSNTPADLSVLTWSYYKLGMYQKAEKILRILIEDEVAEYAEYFDLGLVLLCSRQFAESLTRYERGIGFLSHKFPVPLRREAIFIARRDILEALERDPSIAGAKECYLIQEALKEAWDATQQGRVSSAVRAT